MKRRERERAARETELRAQTEQIGVFFHGGYGGLSVDDLLLPPSRTGMRSTAEFGSAGVTARDRVYLHTDSSHAKMWALLAPHGPGSLYRAVPLDLLEPDPDFYGVGSYSTTSARIVEVVETEVVEWEGLSAQEALKALQEIEAREKPAA